MKWDKTAKGKESKEKGATGNSVLSGNATQLCCVGKASKEIVRRYNIQLELSANCTACNSSGLYGTSIVWKHVRCTIYQSLYQSKLCGLFY